MRNYKEWCERYENKEIVDLKQHFTEKDFELLKKLGVKIKDKIYTEHEFELLDVEVSRYYREDDMDELELSLIKDLETTGVSKEEYNMLFNKIDSINDLYNF